MTQEPDIKCWAAKRKAELTKQIYRGRTTLPEATVTVKVSVAFECFYAARCRASIVSHSLGGGIKGAAAVLGPGLLMPNAVSEHIQTPKISMNPIQGHLMDDVSASFRQMIDGDERSR